MGETSKSPLPGPSTTHDLATADTSTIPLSTTPTTPETTTGEAGTTPLPTTSTTHEMTTIASTTDSNTRRHCYACGDNATRDGCTPNDINNVEACKGDGQTYCMTDVFENGRYREVYKRCATEDDCKEGQRTNQDNCYTSSFLVVDVMECHYCCTTDECNASIRPQVDLYEGD